MEFNDTQMKAVNVSKELKGIFNDRIADIKIYDIVDEPNHYSFKIGFLAYNYFSVVFQYELDIIGCYIEVGKESCISLIDDKCCYSDTDMNSYVARLKSELELRIPDKYLKAKGWI